MKYPNVAARTIPAGGALLMALFCCVLPCAPARAAQQQQERSPRPYDIVATQFSVSARRVRPGQTVRVSMTLQNLGPLVARSQRPSQRTVYTQGESYRSRGYSIRPDRYGVAMTLSGPRGEQWPYRWGIGGDLKLGQIRRVSFPLRLTQPGIYTIFVGVSYGDRVEQAPGGRIDGVEVRGRGRGFRTRPGYRRAPTPVRISVNGKEVATDQRPLFYESRITLSNVQILVPIRFVAEALGADVRWDRQTRTASIRRGEADILLRAGRVSHRVNGREVFTHVPVRVIGGRTMVPIRFVSEQMGGRVNWNSRTRTVEITLPPLSAAAAAASLTAARRPVNGVRS